VSTDKVNAEVPSPVTGVIRELIVKEGETVPTGAPIAIIDDVAVETPAPNGSASPSEQVAAASASSSNAEANRQASDEPVPGGNVGLGGPSYSAPSNGSSGGGPVEQIITHDGGSAPRKIITHDGASVNGIRTSPAVRRLAREHQVDLAGVRGSGDNGRITANDILAAAKAGPSAGVAATISADNAEFTAPGPVTRAAAAPPAAPASASAQKTGTAKPSYANAQPGELIPLTPVRKIIAQRMVESKRTAPHAWTMTEVDVTNVWRWRAREKDAFEKAYGVKLTLLPFFIRAAVESLAKFPLMNASFTDEGIRVHRDVNVGLAIAADGVLVVPVIRHADQLSIKGIALAAGELIDKGRRGKLGADDLAGGTFTVNNTGANGSVLSAPILVPGQTGIVTTEAIVKRAVVRDDDSIAVRSMMNVCLSLDHRVVDGAVASGFLSDLKKRLEAMGPAGSL
ncbi:MAG: hypothetical protein QOJ39_2890, partial [Candidatus Eremiobacteraeota bacterium]|jgi:2-oxoisovalerate dehydrogenase E2 component (dihydrolipoyl transacylase)|nr:hypothetical protein [Candidatus Eremiobacteraeota bacterium]